MSSVIQDILLNSGSRRSDSCLGYAFNSTCDSPEDAPPPPPSPSSLIRASSIQKNPFLQNSGGNQLFSQPVIVSKLRFLSFLCQRYLQWDINRFCRQRQVIWVVQTAGFLNVLHTCTHALESDCKTVAIESRGITLREILSVLSDYEFTPR